MDICADCETSGGDLLSCSGGCARRFHAECIRVTAPEKLWRCPECTVGVHRCFSCSQYANDSALVLCTRPLCGRRFHITDSCRSIGMLALVSNVCGAHHCHAEACISTSSGAFLRCTRCPQSYHAECLPLDSHVLTEECFYCVKHVMLGDLPSALDTSTAIAVGAAGKRRGARSSDDVGNHTALKKVRVQDVIAEQSRQAAKTKRAEADAASARAAEIATAAAAAVANKPGFSIAAAVAQIQAAAAAAKASSDASSSGGMRLAPQINFGRGRGAQLAAQRVSDGSAVTWQQHSLVQEAEIQRRKSWQQTPSEFIDPRFDNTQRSLANNGAYPFVGDEAPWGCHAPPELEYADNSLEIVLSATEGVDSDGRQIFIDAAGSGRTFVLDAAGMPFEVELHYPDQSAAAGGVFYEQEHYPVPFSLAQQPWDRQSDHSGTGNSPSDILQWFSGADAAGGSDSRAFLDALYSRYRCRVCSFRCESKPLLAAHVNGHRTAVCAPQLSQQPAGIDDLRRAHFASESEILHRLSGCGPVATITESTALVEKHALAMESVANERASTPITTRKYCRLWYTADPACSLPPS